MLQTEPFGDTVLDRLLRRGEPLEGERLIVSKAIEPSPPVGDNGRPPPDRGLARRQAFLEAARRVFLDNGFEKASVNDVVRMAGGSLATLYAQFGSKEGLFLAVCQHQHDLFIKDMLPARDDTLPLEQGMQSIGEQFLGALLTRDSLAFFRIVISEARSHPELLQRYIVKGADQVRSIVAEYIDARIKAENLAIKDPDRAASLFFALLQARHHYPALAHEDYVVSPEELTAHVRCAVRFFLAGAPGI